MYDYKNQSEESLQWEKRLYDLNPNFPGIANNLALIYKAIHQMEKALECFQKAEELGPNNTIILTNIGLFYEDLDK